MCLTRSLTFHPSRQSSSEVFSTNETPSIPSMASSTRNLLSILPTPPRWRRNKVLLSFILASAFLSYAFVRQFDRNEMDTRFRQNDESTRVPLKTILYWNSFFGIRDFTFGFGQQPFVNAQCPVSSCLITDDRSLFNDSNVVIFSIQNLNLSDMPVYRFPHQRFVFYEMESPANTDPLPVLHNLTRFGFFNWTMTYRLDSDIVHRDSYGIVLPRRRTSVPWYPTPRRHGYISSNSRRSPYTAARIANKKKLAAWFVSNCKTPSRREDYVRQLSRYIPIDIYGKCGNLTCFDPGQCREMVRSDYKFYIGFENSLCLDYVTEKLTAALLYDTVPIVMGNVDYTSFAPPHSFIDVSDFSSPKELADYLLLLNRTDHLYARYFDWKRDFTVHISPKQGWCHLCKLANEEKLPSSSYEDIFKWWVNDPDECNLPITTVA